MICIHCSAEHDDNAKFCPRTGKLVTARLPDLSSPTAAPARTMVMFGGPLPGKPGPPPNDRTEVASQPPIPFADPPVTPPSSHSSAHTKVDSPRPLPPNSAPVSFVRPPATSSPSTRAIPDTPSSAVSTEVDSPTPAERQPSGVRATEVDPSGNPGPRPTKVDSPDRLGPPPGPAPLAAEVDSSRGEGEAFVGLLRAVVDVYVANFVEFLVMVGVVLGPVALSTSVLTAAVSGAGVPGAATLVLGFVVSLLLAGAAWPLVQGAVVVAVLDGLVGGKVDGRRCLRFVFRRAGALVTAVVPAAFITALGYLLFVVPGLIASLLLAAVPAVVLVEGRQGGEALRRSVAVIREVLGAAAGVLVVYVVVLLLVRKVLTTLVPGHGLLDLLVADLALVALAPLPMIALALLYREARRAEGLTDQQLRDELDASGL